MAKKKELATKMGREKKYNIYRYFRRGGREQIKSGLTLSEAQKHCSDPSTKEEGKWFDGFTDKY